MKADIAGPSHEIPVPHMRLENTSIRPFTPDTDLPTETSSAPSLILETVEDQKSGNARSTQSLTRPPLERRLSNAMENLKDSFRGTLHPPKWNWKRYDREDEILAGFTERVTRMWNRATSGMYHVDQEVGRSGEGGEPSTYRRKRSSTNGSEGYDYHRARNPEVNDLHPPVVSQLPNTRAEAAWMLLPPPSAAVMEARTRPAAEPEMRWPLCVVGRPPKDAEPKKSLAQTLSREQINLRDFAPSNDAEDEDGNVSSASVARSEHGSVGDSEIRPENVSPARLKHLSDPIIRPPPIHPASRIAGDLFIPKRRDSWQFHYVIPSDQPKPW